MTKKTAQAAGLLIFVLFISACDYFETGDRLNGIWVAESGARFTFDNSNFTRIPVYGAAETGTYRANDGLITLSRYGAFVDVTLDYSLQFPYLTIDETRYTSVSSVRPPSPPSIEGFWTLPPAIFAPNYVFPTNGFEIVFRNGEFKGDGIEGEYDMRSTFKGLYNTRRDLISGTDILTMSPTHVHGNHFRNFLNGLPISLFILFDELDTPAFDPGDTGYIWGFFPWWYTPDEVIKYFKDAEARAPTLAIRTELANARRYFFHFFEPSDFNYYLEFTTTFPDELDQNQMVTSGAKNQLILINDIILMTNPEGLNLYRYKPGVQPQ